MKDVATGSESKLGCGASKGARVGSEDAVGLVKCGTNLQME